MTAGARNAMLEMTIQFFHHEKALARMPGLGEELLATLNGLSLADYRAWRADFAAQARAVAEELLDDADFARLVDRLPFAAGATVVGFGDSITDDLQSWLEMLRHLLALRRPADRIEVVNAGISGETTAQLFIRFPAVIAVKPSWIICFAGTNDARRHGQSPLKVLVSPDETARNYMALRHYAATQTAARWLWVTPARVLEEQIVADPFLSLLQLTWRNDDLDTVAALVREQPDPHVDLQALFGRDPSPELFLPDGLHPSLAGQRLIVRAVVERLAAL